MTRTARSSYPRAILKDRSESRSGLDKSLKKGGAGAHSWGDLLEDPSIYPADDDGIPEDNSNASDTLNKPESSGTASGKTESPPSSDSPLVETVVFMPRSENRHRRAGSLSVSYTDEDIALAKQLRTHVFSGGAIDLATIARSSPAVANPANLDISPPTLKAAKSFSSSHSTVSEEH